MVLHHSKKYLLLSLGWLCLALGLIGALLPILPTTPFAILAAFFFSRGSKKLHTWLLARPIIGPLVRDWEETGVIRRQPKIYSTIMIIGLFSYTLIFVEVAALIKVIVCLIGLGVLTFIWTRPETRAAKTLLEKDG